MEKRPSTVALVSVILVVAGWWMSSMEVAVACPADGRVCKACIVERMKYDCPSCAPILRCMSRCLWRGRSKSNCGKACGCDGVGTPTLAQCRRCISRCKCSCTASSAYAHS